MKLSVICPSYNRASFLEECIVPVMEIPQAEFVLIDDGSTDATIEIVQELQARYGEDRILYERLTGNQGAQIARNRGMEISRGEMLLFCDSDDVLVTSGVKELAEVLHQNPESDYAYGTVVMTDARLNPLVGTSPIGSSFADVPSEFAGYHWHTMGALYRKSFLSKVGPWNPDLTGSQDWEYQARVKLAGGEGRFVDTLVGFWRQHEGGRVGARKFRPDYIRSVVTACDVILSLSRAMGKCDRPLQRRLAKKLIIHALECGAHGDRSLKGDCLAHAALATLDDPVYSALIKGLRVAPTWFDEMLWKRLVVR
jgi:glycosyltransferase involved in cell wall biosynthesis